MPTNESRIKRCFGCGSGEDVQCMREIAEFKGSCPVADDAPNLMSSNELAVTLFQEAQKTAQEINTKDKVLLHIRASDLESLMRMREITGEDQENLLMKVGLIEQQANNFRPRKKRPKMKRSGRR